ncbi:MAG: GNAT family N-acetyltransferase [Pseudomonadota bacterium]
MTANHASSTYNDRAYRDESDYALLRQLLVRLFADGGFPVQCTIGDLDWWRCQSDDPVQEIATAHLWFTPEGELAGFAWPIDDEVDIFAHPTHKALEDIMIGWAEDRRLRQQRDGAPVTFQVQTFDSDTTRQAILRQRGYAYERPLIVYRQRLIDAAPRPAPLPDGYAIRLLDAERDVAQRVNAHRDAFAPSEMTEARYRYAMSSPTYRPDLDLVVADGNDDVAAFTTIWLDADNRLGVFEPVGCHAAHRRRGLARAVITEGLRRLHGLGARRAIIGSYLDNDASNQLYESLGFGDAEPTSCWSRPLPA